MSLELKILLADEGGDSGSAGAGGESRASPAPMMRHGDRAPMARAAPSPVSHPYVPDMELPERTEPVPEWRSGDPRDRMGVGPKRKGGPLDDPDAINWTNQHELDLEKARRRHRDAASKSLREEKAERDAEREDLASLRKGYLAPEGRQAASAMGRTAGLVGGGEGQVLSGALDMATGNVGEGAVKMILGGAQALADGFNAAARHAEAFGDAVQRSASNDYMGAFNRGVREVQDSLESIPITGKIVSAELNALVGPLRAMHDTTMAFVQRGRELSRYNSDLALVTAQTDARRMMSDIREADELGPEIAKLTDQEERFYAEFREFALPVKRFLLEQLNDWLEKAITAFYKIRDTGAAILDFLAGISKMLADIFPVYRAMMGNMNQHLEGVARWLRQHAPEFDGVLTRNFLRIFQFDEAAPL